VCSVPEAEGVLWNVAFSAKDKTDQPVCGVIGNHSGNPILHRAFNYSSPVIHHLSMTHTSWSGASSVDRAVTIVAVGDNLGRGQENEDSWHPQVSVRDSGVCLVPCAVGLGQAYRHNHTAITFQTQLSVGDFRQYSVGSASISVLVDSQQASFPNFQFTPPVITAVSSHDASYVSAGFVSAIGDVLVISGYDFGWEEPAGVQITLVSSDMVTSRRSLRDVLDPCSLEESDLNVKCLPFRGSSWQSNTQLICEFKPPLNKPSLRVQVAVTLLFAMLMLNMYACRISHCTLPSKVIAKQKPARSSLRCYKCVALALTMVNLEMSVGVAQREQSARRH
jgi:hypothetical protein